MAATEGVADDSSVGDDGSALPDVAPEAADAGPDPDAGPDAVLSNIGSDAGGSDGTATVDGGADATPDVADASSFDVLASDATSDARDGAATDSGDGGPCTTSFGGQLLFSFNAASSAAGWFTESNVDAGSPPATLAWTGADGHACPGALSLTVAFATYTTAVPDIEFNFGAASWKATKLHMWVKVQIPGADSGSAAYATLDAVSPFVESNAWTNYTFMWLDVASFFGNGGWNEVVVDLIAPDAGQANRFGQNVDLASVQRLGVSLVPQATRPDGGSPGPSTTVLLVDDIWLE